MYQNSTFSTLSVKCEPRTTDKLLLSNIRDYMTKLEPEIDIQEVCLTMFERWLDKPNSIKPLSIIKNLLDRIRSLAPGYNRISSMNTLVRTLAKPEIFATFLDMMVNSSERSGTIEQDLSEISRKSTKHAIYGWCGQTRLVLSGTQRTDNTIFPEPGVENYLGNTPTCAWSLSMHIWQPNPNARGFKCGNQIMNNISEPPHTHPFDFVSAVVVGEMHQSIYEKSDNELVNSKYIIKNGRYDGVNLIHVDGVWPPHKFIESTSVVTIEDRTLFKSGDSYFMSSEVIHDVQIDSKVASLTPAITLFLRSESYAVPHVYMAPSMLDYHQHNPDLKNIGIPLSKEVWQEKLKLVADYVRGKCLTLDLSKIVNYKNEYAFFHI